MEILKIWNKDHGISVVFPHWKLSMLLWNFLSWRCVGDKFFTFTHVFGRWMCSSTSIIIVFGTWKICSIGFQLCVYFWEVSCQSNGTLFILLLFLDFLFDFGFLQFHNMIWVCVFYWFYLGFIVLKSVIWHFSSFWNRIKILFLVIFVLFSPVFPFSLCGIK